MGREGAFHTTATHQNLSVFGIMVFNKHGSFCPAPIGLVLKSSTMMGSPASFIFWDKVSHIGYLSVTLSEWTRVRAPYSKLSM